MTSDNRAASLPSLTKSSFLNRPDARWLLAIPGLDALAAQCPSHDPALQSGAEELRITFVAPVLPHPCELDLWNAAVASLGCRARVLTAVSEVRSFRTWTASLTESGITCSLDCQGLQTTNENRTFLAGLEAELGQAGLVVAVGEASLASFQAVKVRRETQNRLVIWQNAPRPPVDAAARLRPGVTGIQSQISREKTIRREVLRNCDAVVALDKDGAAWAYLEGVNAQRLRRLARGIDLARYSRDVYATKRIAMRAELGLPETDFIFLQAGPLEIEAGALDTVHAFKHMLLSHPEWADSARLVFCGTGTASAEVRQSVVELKLEPQVFFLNPNDPEVLRILGNQLTNLLPLCDVLVHNPLGIVNDNPLRCLDCSFDVLCALASGVTLVSNGHGWAGEWLARFYRTFAPGNIHAQARLMSDSLARQDKLGNIKQSVRRALENELQLTPAAEEFASMLGTLLSTPAAVTDTNMAEMFSTIEKCIQGQRYLDAIQVISQAFALPDLTKAQQGHLFRHVGDCFTKLGDLDNGLQNYMRAYDIDPYCAKTLIGLGTIALQNHDYNIAVPQFQKAVALAPQDPLASLGLGLAFEGLGEKREALAWTVRACELDIDNTAALFNLVKLSHDLEDYTDAACVLSRYVELHPHDVNMIFTLGGIVFKQGDRAQASRLMERILVLDPMNGRAHGLLAQIKPQKEQKKQA